VATARDLSGLGGRAASIALAALLGCGSGDAQESPDTLAVAPGARVRVAAHLLSCQRAHVYTGALALVYRDTVLVHLEHTADTLAVPLNAVRRFEVSAGGRSATRGARRGAAIGLLAGAVAGAIVPSVTCSEGEICRVRPATVLLGAAGGAGLGAAIGLGRPAERWVRVPLPARIRLSPDCPRYAPPLPP
jgi:hypothetical protein